MKQSMNKFKVSISKNQEWQYNCNWHEISLLNGDFIWYKLKYHYGFHDLISQSLI